MRQTQMAHSRPCAFLHCTATVPSPARKYCDWHTGTRLCQHESGCRKFAQGKTVFCLKHGGGIRCSSESCDKAARHGGLCVAHGGRARCSASECQEVAVGNLALCAIHGGKRECKRENCNKYAQGRSGLCVNHGGGRKCIFPDCEKVARGTTSFCVAHGGGTRCQQHGCSREALVGQTTCRKHALGGRAVKGANLGTQEFCGVCSKKKRKLISNRLGADEQVNSDSRPFKRPKRWVTNIVDIDDAIPTDIGAINQLLISDEILLANDALLALEYWGQQENVEAVDDKDVVEYAHCYPEIPNSGASLTRNRGCVVALSLNEDDVVADLNEIMQSNTAGLT